VISYPLRATRWAPFIVMACIATSYLAAHTSTGDDPKAAVETMRVVTLLLALGCCAAFDDAAAVTLAASPTRLWHRRARHAVVTLVPAALLWLLAFVMVVPRSGASAATTGLLLEAATLLAFVWTTALVAQRFGLHEPSPITGSVAVAADLAIIGLPHSITLFTALDDPAWHAAHQHWAALLAGLVVIAAGAVRDPAGRRFRRFATRRPPDEQYWPYADDLI
jgi:hypothetical protein